MKKQIIYSIMAIALISLVSAGIGQKYTPYNFFETQDLSVLDDAMIGNNLRVNGLIEVAGNMKIEHECTGDAQVMVDENGIVYLQCVPSKIK